MNHAEQVRDYYRRQGEQTARTQAYEVILEWRDQQCVCIDASEPCPTCEISYVLIGRIRTRAKAQTPSR